MQKQLSLKPSLANIAKSYCKRNNINEKQFLKDIEKLVNLKIPSKIKHGYEPDPNAVPEPPKQQNRNNFRGNKGRSNQNKKRNNYRK